MEEQTSEELYEEVLDGKPKHHYGVTPYEERSPKVSDALMEQRYEDIIELLVKQKSNSEIKKVICEKYGIAPATATKNICAATKVMVERMPDVKEIIAKNCETYRKLAEEAVNESDRRTAIIALQAQEKLLRLHQPEFQVQNNTLNLNIESVDLETLIELMRNAK